jgi:hypothetical protein
MKTSQTASLGCHEEVNMMWEHDPAVIRAIHQDRIDRANRPGRRRGTRHLLPKRRGRG